MSHINVSLHDSISPGSAAGCSVTPGKYRAEEGLLMVARDMRALLFDVFGTLVDWRTGVARDAAVFLARHGGGDAGAFADAWRRRYAPAMERVRSGARPFVRLDVLHRENLIGVLEDFGIDPAGVAPDELDALNLAWHRLDPWPDVPGALARLKTRFIVAPLSNGNVSLMIDLARRGGLPWDAILGAEVVQAYKPQPEAYFRTVDMLAMRPGEVCLVAAHNSDLAAARACGLLTCFVPRPEEHGPARNEADVRPAQDWDFVVRDLDALAERLSV